MKIYARPVGVVHQGCIICVLNDALVSAALLAGRQDQGAGARSYTLRDVQYRELDCGAAD
jgi:hypothetical protein